MGQASGVQAQGASHWTPLPVVMAMQAQRPLPRMTRTLHFRASTSAFQIPCARRCERPGAHSGASPTASDRAALESQQSHSSRVSLDDSVCELHPVPHPLRSAAIPPLTPLDRASCAHVATARVFLVLAAMHGDAPPQLRKSPVSHPPVAWERLDRRCRGRSASARGRA